MDLLQREFSAQAVAMATGATAKQISDWCNQGQIVGQREPLGRGHKRTFSFFNVMEVAVALALMEIGVRAPADAFRAAQGFAHAGGSGEARWADSATENVRIPGLPYHYSRMETFAFVAGRECLITTDPNVKTAMDALGNVGGLLVVNVSGVFADVMHRLGLGHAEVLDALYMGGNA